jgi:glucose-6-phosphate isomerase
MAGFSQANELPAWSALAQHHKTLSKDIVLREYFQKDPERFAKFSRVFKNKADGAEILFDFSKNFLTEETLGL